MAMTIMLIINLLRLISEQGGSASNPSDSYSEVSGFYLGLDTNKSEKFRDVPQSLNESSKIVH
jgi:hypothetical protein